MTPAPERTPDAERDGAAIEYPRGMLSLRSIALLVGFWPYIPPRRSYGGHGHPPSFAEVLTVFLILILILGAILLTQKAFASLKRRWLREALRALSRHPMADARCVVAATVTSGDLRSDPWSARPAVWFRVAMFVREVPPGQTRPRGVVLDHGERFTLTAGDATIDVYGRDLETLAFDGELSRHAYSDQLPEHLRKILADEGAPLAWSDGSPVLWFLSAAAIRVGDALTVVGTTRAATEGGTEVEANAAAGGGYREGPAPRTFWRISSGPSRNNGPLVSSRSPEEIPAVVAEFLAVDGRPTWLR